MTCIKNNIGGCDGFQSHSLAYTIINRRLLWFEMIFATKSSNFGEYPKKATTY